MRHGWKHLSLTHGIIDRISSGRVQGASQQSQVYRYFRVEPKRLMTSVASIIRVSGLDASNFY